MILDIPAEQKRDRYFSKKVLRALFKDMTSDFMGKTIKGKTEKAICPKKVQFMRDAFAYHLRDTGRYNESYFIKVFSSGLNDIKQIYKNQQRKTDKCEESIVHSPETLAYFAVTEPEQTAQSAIDTFI